MEIPKESKVGRQFCIDCGNTLTPNEIKYYEHTCENCENKIHDLLYGDHSYSESKEDVFIEIGYSNESIEKKLNRRQLRLESVKDKTLAEIMELLEDDKSK